MKKLSSLDVSEVSLVPRGANKKKFLVFKSRKGRTMPKNPTNDIRQLIDGVSPETMKRVEAVVKGMKQMQKDAGDMPPKKDSAVFKEGEEQGEPMSDRAQAALKAVGRILAPFKDEIHDGHLDAVQHEVGIKDGPSAHEEPADKELEGEEDMEKMDSPEGVDKEHHMEAMKSAKEAYKAHLSKMGYRKYPDASKEDENGEVNKGKDKQDLEDDEEDEEEESVGKSNVAKSLDLSAFPEKQRPQLEAIFKSFDERTKELVKKNDTLEAELKARDEREREREYVAKAESFKHVGLAKADMVETLRDAAKSGAKSYERICKQYEALNEQGKSSNVFGEIGSRISNAGGADAEQKLNALVDMVVQKSAGEKTKAEIYDDVLKTQEGKRLYAEMKSQRPGGI